MDFSSRSLLALTLLLGSAGLGMTIASPALASESGNAPSLRIAHAEKTETCGFAPVIVGPRKCTATLVHPKLVICAAHCGTQIRSVSFGENSMRPGQSAEVEYCKKHPGHPNDKGKDWSFCVLKEAVTDLPVIPPAFGCELEQFMKVGQKVTQVGFGANAGKHGQSKGTGIKRWAENKVTELKFTHDDNIKVGPNSENVVACPGDSGGPLLIQMDDGSWRTMAIASKYSGNCGAENPFNIYARIAKAVSWIEEESKIDITPCFDSDGTWNPTKDCKGFYAGDASAQGSWDKWCEDAPRSGYSSTCGEPFGGAKAPKISVSSPKEGTEIEADSFPTKVTISAKLDGEKPESFTMGLVINKEEIQDSAKSKKPWTWEYELEEGEHEVALWYDIGKQKRQQSEGVTITVVASSESSNKDPSTDPTQNEPSEQDPSEQNPSGKDSGDAPKESGPEENSGDEDEPSSSNKNGDQNEGSKNQRCNSAGSDGGKLMGLLGLGLLIFRRRGLN